MYSAELKKIAIERPYQYQDEASFVFFCTCRNRSCADDADIYIQEQDGLIKAMRYRGEGCIFSHASAHCICEIAQNSSRKQLQDCIRACLDSIDGEHLHEVLKIFAGIPRNSSRVKCYRYIWETVYAALTR